MAEIAAVPGHGLRVASLFAGAGGSCLGYRMAGYRILWANEFIEAARHTYRANNPTTLLDPRDIRTIDPQDILTACDLVPGELDLLDGSPPCASFSTAGKRAKGWGQVKAYSDTKQRTDDLFFEYARLLEGLQPKVFVAENVSGLVKGVAKGYFKQILARLRACGYTVEARLLDAQWLGVPQARQRIFFVGVRADLPRAPAFPQPLPYRYSVRDALPWIVRGKYGPTWRQADLPSPTVSAGLSYKPETSHQNLELVEAETDIARYAIGREWNTLQPGEKSAKYFSLQKPALDKPSPTMTAPASLISAAAIVHPLEKRYFSIAELKRLGSFPDDFQLTGTYAQQWERIGRAVPPVMMAHLARTIAEKVLL
jgi:DNA (cytosine-5)-methyltransferase 1